MKILIVDDHAIVRAGLKQIISSSADMFVVDEADSANEALAKLRKTDYSLVMLDIFMPGKSGLDALREIKSEYPGLPVLMLSMYPEEQYAIRTLRLGAAGYMKKDALPEEVLTAVRKVGAGRKYISPSVAEKLAVNLDVETKKEVYETLSDREYEILRMIATGKTAGEIAAQLHLSVKTISTYRRRILEKMQLKNNAELINYALKTSLLDAGPS
jgi:two-component system invasion response regulator UvrY